MVKRVLRVVGLGSVLAGLLVAFAGSTPAQSVTPVPTLDLNHFMGVWYEEARLPSKPEKQCVSDAMHLYSLGDKPKRFQMVISCTTKTGVSDARGATGKMNKKSNDGKLTISYIWPFSSKDWVLALGADYEWALMGSPNHKAMWILSRTSAMSPEVLAEIKSKALAQGFKLEKLITVSQKPVVAKPIVAGGQ